MLAFVGLDVGATNCRIMFKTTTGLVRTQTISTTAASYHEWRDRVVHAIRKLVEPYHTVASVCIAIAGATEDDVLIGSSNLKHLVKQPIQADFSDAFGGVPVALWNDCKAAGLAEFMAWQQPVVYIAPGTGVGVCLAFSEHFIQATELGHMIIDINELLKCGDGCGGGGHLEAFVGGASIEKRHGTSAEHIGLEEWGDVLMKLAVGIRNIALAMSGAPVVLGGSLALGRLRNSGDLPRLQTMVSQLPATAPAPQLGFARYGEEAGLEGAVIVAKQLAQAAA